MRSGLLLRAVLAVVMVGSGCLCAQESTPATLPSTNEPRTEEPYKLHVYAKLLQVPTIIRDSDHSVPMDLTRERVKISLDGGPEFSPTFLRMEGEDPLSVGVLLETTGSQQATLDEVVRALPDLLPSSLRAGRDHISLFAVDCLAFRTSLPVSQGPAAMALTISSLLQQPGIHGAKSRGACQNSLKLWDTAAIAIKQLSETNGRRVLLIVSQGDDQKSKMTPSQLALFAANNGVAIFGLRSRALHESERLLDPGGRWSALGAPIRVVNSDDPLGYLAARNGGLVYDVYDKEAASVLKDFFETLRSRYILEFTAPAQATRGSHSIAVTVPGLHGLVRASGSSAPLPDPAALADPTTLPSKPSEAVFGKTRPSEN